MGNAQDIKYFIDLLLAMTEKEMKARYKHAVFGFLWVLLNPLFQMAVIGVIFSFFVRVNVENYFLFLFTGLLPWQFFSLSLTKSTPAFVFERSLLQKAKFPHEVIPLSIILSNFSHLAVSLSLLIIFLYSLGSLQFPRILWLIPALISLLLLTIGVSFLTAALQVRFRDVKFIVESLLIIWFYATPILYNLELISTTIRRLFFLNPLASIFEVFHFAILGQAFPDKTLLASNAIVLLIILMVGVAVFKREQNYFVDWL